MKLTQGRKVMIGVLGLALAGLLFDRVILGGGATSPKVAEAASEAADAQTPEEAFVFHEAMKELEARRARSTGLLKGAASHQMDVVIGQENERPNDVFVPSAQWTPATVQTPNVAAPSTVVDTDFASRYRLTAVMRSGDRSFAVINGRTVRVGETVESFTLIAVGERTAVFESENQRVVLEVELGMRNQAAQ